MLLRQAAISILSPPGKNLILLGLNNQGRHKGRIIPPSETVNPGETPLEAAYRGIREEVLRATTRDLRQVGGFQVFFEGVPEHNIELHIFRGTIVGQPLACSKEFSWLRFFRPRNIRVGRMWPDAKYWFPRVLELGPDDPVLGLRLLLPAEPRFVVSRITPPSSDEITFAVAG